MQQTVLINADEPTESERHIASGVREKGYYCSVGAKENRSEGDQSGPR